MRLSNFASVGPVIALAVFLLLGCGSSNDAAGPAGPTPQNASSSVPFSTAEPERYQALVVTAAAGREVQTFVARDGASRRIEYRRPDGDLIVIRTDSEYLISPAAKTYIERPLGGTSFDGEPVEGLTERLLARRSFTRFEELASDADRRTFRAMVDGASGSEARITVDESLGLPVRVEHFSNAVEGPVMIVELRDISLSPAAELFSLPDGYRKVSEEEFFRTLRGGN